MFPTIKQYFEMGLYTEDDIKLFLDTEMITQDEYDQIILPVVDEPTEHEKDTGDVEIPKGDINDDLLEVDKPEEDTVDE